MSALNLDHYWMPFTPNRVFKRDPRLIVGAKGMYYRSQDGRDILDGTAGLWCVNAGHAHPVITAAVAESVRELDYAPGFLFSHPGAFRLAERLAGLFPGDVDHFFFTNSGSEAVDTALKIALAYHRARGEGSRTRLIGRERGYHGVGFGGISVGGIPRNRMYFGSLLAGVDHLRHTHDPVRNPFPRGEVEHGAELADDLQRLVELHDASTIAAVIVEPVAGSTGVLPPPRGYLKRLREICDAHGILLIFDEVITAFGRLGAATAAERFGVQPDMITFAKGVTSGVVPMGGVGVRAPIHDAMMAAADAPIELFHGYTYSGHPLATAAALATLDVYQDEGLFQRSGELAGVLEEAAHALRDRPHVVDIRTIGVIAGIELASRPDAPGARATEVMQAAWERGVMVRITGDVLAFSPPLIASEEEIRRIFQVIGDVLQGIA